MTDSLVGAGLDAITRRLQSAPIPRPRLQLLPHQTPPEWEDDTWDRWLLLAGRGSGKTLAASHFLNKLLSANRGWSARIIAPTVGDAREACVLGATGLLAVNPDLRWRINEQSVTWPNGSRARIHGAFTPEDVERLRASTNSHVDWYEELAAWPKLDESYVQASFGLRMGRHPREIITTTPKPRERLRRLLKDPKTRLHHATTDDNPFLPELVRRRLEEEYAGTRMGRQELQAELLEDVEGALWASSMIDPHRVHEAPPLSRVVVAIDPAKTQTYSSDETGLVVVARGRAEGADVDHAYVLADFSGKYTPNGWAKKAIWAWEHFGASYVVAETNIAGDLVTTVIHDVDKDVPVRPVRSKQSKEGRAQPAVGLYEQGRVHHVGVFPALEDQQYAFTGVGTNDEADDRVDALVLGLRELELVRQAEARRGWRVYG